MRIDLSSIGIDETTFGFISNSVSLMIRVEPSQSGLAVLVTVEEKGIIDILGGEQDEAIFDWSIPPRELGYAVMNMVHDCYNRFVASRPVLGLTPHEWTL